MPHEKPLPHTQQSLAEALSKYLKYLETAKSVSPHTSKSYAIDLGQFYRPWGILIEKTDDLRGENCKGYQVKCVESGLKGPWQDTDLLQLLEFILPLWQPLKPASRNRKVASVRAHWKWMHQEGLFETALQERLQTPKVPQRLPLFLSLDEILSVFKSLRMDLQAETSPLEEMSLFLLLYGGGLRISEACSLKWSEVDLSMGQMRVLGKGQKQRVTALPQAAIDWLRQQPRRGDYILGGEEVLSSRKAYEWVRQRGVKAGLLKPIHPHALRHSYATHLLSSGMDLRILQEALGHSSLSATQKYTHLSLQELHRTMNAHHPLAKKIP
ncbi:MAG: tyrosine-type recombinase/integrase [Bdellovibrionales bacterium]|nr:tyrosine-type recombinase/integrase [Bdellovibrionales bacterium]